MSIASISGGTPDFSALRAQFEEARNAKFASFDADESGGLSLDELKEAQANSPFAAAKGGNSKSVDEIFASLDADGNGEVSSSEFSAAKPPSGGPIGAGSFSPEMFLGLLSAQEESLSGGASIVDLFTSTTPDESEEVDLVDALLGSLEDNEDSEETEEDEE